ncbi:hypothetical protein VDGD_21349 [Verticillium dahliae]|nr:hypothetical protein VDGD_21349 [Verticillium dahliae]
MQSTPTISDMIEEWPKFSSRCISWTQQTRKALNVSGFDIGLVRRRYPPGAAPKAIEQHE